MFRLSVAQAPADLQTPDSRLQWLGSVLPGIVKSGADLVLLPELFACGYNIGDKVVERAETINGPTRRTMTRLAQEHRVAVHYGFAERCGNKIFNAAACISPEGLLLDHYRKMLLPPGAEREFFSAGRGCKLFHYHGLCIATLICYDAEFAETVRHVAGLGADLILVPTALGAQWSWVAHQMIPTRAYENGVYLAYANSAGIENGMEYLGASVIAAPNGTEAARAGSNPEIIHAALDKTQVTAAQRRLPYLVDRGNIQFNH